MPLGVRNRKQNHLCLNYFANGFFEKYAALSNLINFKQIHWEFFYAKRNQK